jgi:hypothetical protein
MSQQAAAGQGAGRGGGRKPGYFPRGGGINVPAKGYTSVITEIAQHTFNMGKNKFPAQFTESCKKVANYMQRNAIAEGYLVAETICTGKQQTIKLPPAVDPNAADKADLEIIRAKDVKLVAKKCWNLEELLKKGYATMYDQCLQEVQDKLKMMKDWETMQKEQSLHNLITKFEKICIGFDDHKQLAFNLVQSLKTLFLYTQAEKDAAEEYARNFQSLWDTVEAFGGLPEIHKGIVDAELATKNITNQSPAQTKAAQEVANEVVKAALLISGADRRKYGKLKDELANKYLLGTDQYPNTFDKAARILGNYQTTRVGMPYKASPNNTGVAFLQQGGQGGQGAGRGGQGGCGQKNDGSAGRTNGAGANNVSTMTGRTGTNATRTNRKGESHCFNCGSPSHWAYKCPQLSGKQQAQLHMNIEAQEDGNQEQPKEGHQLLNVTLAQGGALPDNQAYLNGCSTVTTFKSGKYLKGIKMVQGGIKINCIAGAVVTNNRGTYKGLKVWYLPNGIANIFLMHELEKLYRMTYDSWKGYYIVHTPKGEVRFYKDEQGLPYLDLEE